MAEMMLADQAYETVMDRILKGELVPGQMFNRRDLAKDLGMSPAPVLEAMVRLESEGFIETIPRKGTRVRLIRREDIRGQLILREAIECQAARMCCGNPVKNEYDRILEYAKNADTNHGDPIKNWESEFPFHRVFVELAECPRLLRIFDRVMSRSLFYNIHHILHLTDTEVKNVHVDLLDKMTTGSKDKAEKAMRIHIESGRKGVLFSGS